MRILSLHKMPHDILLRASFLVLLGCVSFKKSNLISICFLSLFFSVFRMHDVERYPIGTFLYGKIYSDADVQEDIQRIARLPEIIESALFHCSDDQLRTPYRKDGWTVAQVVHHLADSHLNAYTRIKLALTEDTPTIKPYNEAAWALLADAQDTSRHAVENSLALLRALHRRWVQMLISLNDDQLARTFIHPESHRICPLREVIANYAWHGEHHHGHIMLVQAQTHKAIPA